MHPRLRSSTHTETGFTLVEVMVALLIMAVLTTMAWQGIDGLMRARDGAQRSGEAALRLGTVMSQWEQDLSQVQQSNAAPGLRFDGASLRLTRRGPGGIQLVVWTLQGGNWYRWAAPPVTRIQDLQEWWIRSQQWSTIQGDALKMLEQVESQQIYFFRGNSWSNAQSTGDIEEAPPPQPPASGVQPPQIGGENEALPTGVRLVLKLPNGLLTRDLMVRPSQ
ncbi:MAG TPA: prepilin-type N-terminal cleavage/methylation domain-containing protein [Ideonella sp.]|uniref:prepilin-type N-terminal cleavage/methylation domain-containing protein n=1 Tax=Ideonella sp. TaxID=1929293 RepID=UPI002E30C782|nr:prepilin-type N-terminal cleavage/methylation domain-containing protein [Ideonella sp.]HEX5687057.1 prepilin-type N-terminal cleavage/methylation domain-containing protein [Ideonella sp.]